ncbi:retinoblastoma family protein-like [Teleopsis dalmanni]|uniref:retinoblastoma family protein-like n=1 Tax=Teleopsis dalmanni TaxID=139649 RepID=UPI0018CF95CF|nr:retinoblastoma family protein-like [Teleopsis dalmanni]XP_037942054.1 retinoblastoma family protein-like [Teleopsis dalmanni]
MEKEKIVIIDGDIKTKYEELCRELNMDKETEESAWNKFSDVSQRTSLEGDPVHWFCCALYAACRASYTPTVGENNTIVVGNCVSLNKVLRSCNMSIYDFISKIKNWHEMANLSENFFHQIERLERTSSITFHLFHYYNKAFDQLFQYPPYERKNTKYRSATKCSSNKLYDIGWCLYLCAKNENPSYTVDLITSFHLLLCCIDLLYINVLAENRTDLINPSFSGIPEDWGTDSFDRNLVHNHCIINHLSRLIETKPSEVKFMKNNSWKIIIRRFFQTNTISGNEETFLGIVSNSNFERNLKCLNSTYEQYILSVGEFDERIIINNPKYRRVVSAEYSGEERVEHQEIKSLIPDTPYTRKSLLPNKETNLEPVANATHNVNKLQGIAHISEPTDFIKQAGPVILQKIGDKLNLMSQQFCKYLPHQAEGLNRFQLATSLYYYLLEKIIRVEIRTKPIDIKILLINDIFNATLIACSVEIVLDAYNSQLKFPWVLDCFGIDAYQYYKIIEIVVARHEDILNRALIKHLNFVEEACLESLVWKNSSPIWNLIESISSPLPSWSEVDISNISLRQESQIQSPMNSACETFMPTAITDSAKRDLFNVTIDSLPYDKPNDNTKRIPDGMKRSGSLPLFLRKFYKLAWIRIKELVMDLRRDNELCLKKIWTLFEYSITQKTELMKDRHLDQILMCAIYLYIKVREIQGSSFTDIMKSYRKQPQATSSTYRDVFIDEKDGNRDIIHFYNNIYVQNMSPYALSFSEKNKSVQSLTLSPHPTEKQNFPRKLSTHPLVYVHPMEKNEKFHSPNDITYEFCKSPGKDLRKLNEKIRCGKRNLPFNDDSDIMTAKIQRKIPLQSALQCKITEIIKDRQADKK